MTNDLLSVVIPTYNRAHLIVDCVESVLAQSYSPIEIFVVDDGSTDDTKDVLKKYDGKITYVYQENQGQAAARKNGLEWAEGEFLALLDSDDLWLSDFASTSIGLLKATGAVLAFSNFNKIDCNGNVIVDNVFRSERDWIFKLFPDPSKDSVALSNDASRELYLRHFPHNPSSSLFHKDFLVTIPTERHIAGEDYLFYASNLLCSRGHVAFTSRVLCSLRIHSGNVYQSQPFTDEIGQSWIESKKHLLRLCDTELSSTERKKIKRLMANDYFDWAYACAEERRFCKSIALYLKSFVQIPSSRAIIGIGKALVKLFKASPNHHKYNN